MLIAFTLRVTFHSAKFDAQLIPSVPSLICDMDQNRSAISLRWTRVLVAAGRRSLFDQSKSGVKSYCCFRLSNKSASFSLAISTTGSRSFMGRFLRAGWWRGWVRLERARPRTDFLVWAWKSTPRARPCVPLLSSPRPAQYPSRCKRWCGAV